MSEETTTSQDSADENETIRNAEQEIGEAENVPDSTEPPSEIPPLDELDELKMEVERLQAESHEYLDGWQRARAEFINFKRRTTEERSNSRARISGDILTHFIDIIDDLDLALENRPEENGLEAWIAGIELIRQKFILILQAEGVETIPTEAGSCFDPTLHEAVTYEDASDHEEGEIIGTVKQGYRLNDRVLRPVHVRVAK